MTAITVIGIGSPHGADQTGWEVIECLKQEHTLQTLFPERITLISCDRPGTILLDYLKDADLAVLVDAIEGGTAGNRRRLTKDEILIAPSSISSHVVGVAEALALGDKLDILPEQIVLFGLETGNQANGYIPGEDVIKQLANSIVAELEDYFYQTR